MEFVRFSLLLLALLTVFSAKAQAFSQEWYQCQSDSDCVKVNAGCACGATGDSPDVEVNKKFKDQYAQNVKELCATPQPPVYTTSKQGIERHCDAATHRDDASYHVKCVEHACQVWDSDD